MAANTKVVEEQSVAACLMLTFVTDLILHPEMKPIYERMRWSEAHFPDPDHYFDGEATLEDCRKMLVAWMRLSLELLEKQQ